MTQFFLPKVPVFKCEKMALRMRKQKNGDHFFMPTSPQNDGLHVCFMHSSLLGGFWANFQKSHIEQSLRLVNSDMIWPTSHLLTVSPCNPDSSVWINPSITLCINQRREIHSVALEKYSWVYLRNTAWFILEQGPIQMSQSAPAKGEKYIQSLWRNRVGYIWQILHGFGSNKSSLEQGPIRMSQIAPTKVAISPPSSPPPLPSSVSPSKIDFNILVYSNFCNHATPQFLPQICNAYFSAYSELGYVRLKESLVLQHILFHPSKNWTLTAQKMAGQSNSFSPITFPALFPLKVTANMQSPPAGFTGNLSLPVTSAWVLQVWWKLGGFAYMHIFARYMHIFSKLFSTTNMHIFAKYMHIFSKLFSTANMHICGRK